MVNGNDDRLRTSPAGSYSPVVGEALPPERPALPEKTELQNWQERCSIVEAALSAANDVLQHEFPAWQERCTAAEAALATANAQLQKELPAWERRCTATEEALDAANRRFDEEVSRWRHRCELAEATLASLQGVLEQRSNNSIDTSAFLNFVSTLTPSRAVGIKKKRIGDPKDGGYVMLDDLDRPPLVLSLGVGDDVSWDHHMADLGAKIHQYDHTVPPPIKKSASITFYPKRIVDVPGDVGVTLEEALPVLEGAEIDRPAILKMDIEGNEWTVLDAVSDIVLHRFDQIVCEFHDFDQTVNSAWFARAARVMDKLHQNFQVVHVHGNNNGSITVINGIPIPSVLEVTYANRSRYTFESTDETFPTALDRPNHPGRPDFWLGSFSFPQSN